MDRYYREVQGPDGQRLGRTLGRANAGLGKVFEYLAHQWLKSASGNCEVPVQITAVAVGPGVEGREALSIDLSAFGDPLHNRSVRLPWTLYRKAALLGAPEEISRRPIVVVPATIGQSPPVAASQSLHEARQLARRSSTVIPEASMATEALITEYEGSALADFHRDYESVSMPHPNAQPKLFDSLDLTKLPRCVQLLLDEPNDRLLKPEGMQHLVRFFLGLDWHPRRIAGLIMSRFGRDYGWVPDLHFHQPECRADFYVRLFAGLVMTGRDQLLDFNCQSASEKELCPHEPCGWNLTTVGGMFRSNHDP